MRDVGNSFKPSKMANVKFVKTKKRPRADDAQPEHLDDTPPPRRPAGRPRKAHRAVTAAASAPAVLPEIELAVTFAHPKPAAFPSLPTDRPPSPAPTIADNFAGNGMREMMDALEKADKETVTAIQRHIDGLYATGTDKWYEELRGRWGKDESDTGVSKT